MTLSIPRNRLCLQDVKPLNIVRFGEDWKLIDLDAAVQMGSPLSEKCVGRHPPVPLLHQRECSHHLPHIIAQSCRFSSAYVAPEMLYKVRAANLCFD